MVVGEVVGWLVGRLGWWGAGGWCGGGWYGGVLVVGTVVGGMVGWSRGAGRGSDLVLLRGN